MNSIRIKLYKILRDLGLEKTQINLFSLFNEELKLDQFDRICYITSLENRFNISIPDKDLPRLMNIDNTIEYLYKMIREFGG